MPEDEHFFGLDDDDIDWGVADWLEGYTDEFGDAWTAAYINSLPDIAFAVVKPGGEKDDEGKTVPRSLRMLPHHNTGVKSATENSSVDKPHLRNALARANQADLTPEQKSRATSHLRRHAKALGIGDEEIDAWIDEIDDASPTPGGGAGGKCVCPDCGYESKHKTGTPCYKEKCPKCGAKMQRKEEVEDEFVLGDINEAIEGIETIDEAEEMLLNLEDDDKAIEAIETRLTDLKMEGRKEIVDSFVGEVKSFTKTDSGAVNFTAIVAQTDKPNLNNRLYPKEEFEKNLGRVNRMARAGRFRGTDGHPGMFSGAKPSDVCVKWEAAFIKDSNVYLKGTLIPTSKGSDIITTWEHGVAAEFSIIGYGDLEDVTPDDKRKKSYYKVVNYVWDGCDVVDRGAASTKIVSFEHVEADQTNQEVIVMADEKPKDTAPEEETPPVETPPMEAPKDSKPEIDINAIVEQAKKDATEAAKEAVKQAVEAGKAAAQLEAAKQAALSSVADAGEVVSVPLSRALDRCNTVEEIHTALEEFTPLLAQLKKPDEPMGFGIITGDDAQLEKFWVPSTGREADRPDTIEGVKRGLLEGLGETPTQSNPSQQLIFNQLLDNMWAVPEYRKYFYACTKRGFQETATTTTALGTTLPQVLPLIRSVFSMLLPYELQSVQALNGPSGRIHFIDVTYASGTYSGSTFDDSSAFDSDWSDHTEAATKSQAGVSVSSTDVTSVEKAIYYHLTSALIQDMRALHGIDAEQLLLGEMASQIAREINIEFVDTMYQGASAAAETFGTTKPSAWNSQELWTSLGLAQWVAKTSGKIAEKLYVDADWIITDPPTAAMLSGMEKNWAVEKNPPNQYGLGARKLGQFQNQYDVYVCSWMNQVASNVMLMGFRPPTWNHTATVFAPYIMGYISPEDYDASTNTAKRSVASRYAIKVVQGNGLGYLTISRGAAGTDPWAAA